MAKAETKGKTYLEEKLDHKQVKGETTETNNVQINENSWNHTNQLKQQAIPSLIEPSIL